MMITTFQQFNEQYLATALSWLHWRLRWYIEQIEEAPESEAFAKMAQAAAVLDDYANFTPPPLFIQVCQSFQLSPFEGHVLLLCIAQEFEPNLTALYARAQSNAQKAYPTFSLALSLFEQASWNALSPEGALQYWKLIEVHEQANQPLTASPLRADKRIVNHIKGLNHLDQRLELLLSPLEVEESQISASQQASVHAISEHVEQTRHEREWPIVQLLGSDQASKQLVAYLSSAALRRKLYCLPSTELLPQEAKELATFARLWQRETMLIPVTLYLDAFEMDQKPTLDGPASTLSRFLSRSGGLIFLDSYDIRTSLKRASLQLDIRKPTASEQRAAWATEVGSLLPKAPALLAGQFNQSLGQISAITADVLPKTPVFQEPEPHTYAQASQSQRMLWQGCLRRTRPKLKKLAQRLEPKATWFDIVLHDNAYQMLRQLTDQVRERSQVYDEWGFRRRMNRGLGVLALLAGKSGTGKTMAAEVLANDLELDLYRIDLSSVVNKYIGETEKNLRRLFDAAEDSGAILFFDEADALFGKRSQVKDSRDRYANLEVNYLLQRIESYQGLALLATNMKNSMDSAFIRRLRFVIDFPMPNKEARLRIWKRIFPKDVPLNELDYQRLACFKLSGGNISNIALNASFQAAHLNRPVSMRYVLNAVRAEYLKLQRLIDETDLF